MLPFIINTGFADRLLFYCAEQLLLLQHCNERMRSFRNILVHNQFGQIDAQTVTTVIDRHLNALEASVRAMLESNS